MRCDKCGAENREESRFCRDCAAPIGESTARRDGEPPAAAVSGRAPTDESGVAPGAGDREKDSPPVADAQPRESAPGDEPPRETDEGDEPPRETDEGDEPTRETDEGDEPTRETVAGEPTILARVLATAWMRKGPILMSTALVLMIAMVWAPWAFIRIEIVGLSLVSRSFSGWDIYIARALFFLLIIPLVISLMMVAGIGTRRRVVETHIITFFLGFMFLVWGAAFGLSELLKSLMKNLKVVQVIPAGAQIATLIFLLILVLGIIITQYDRGRQLLILSEGG